MLKLKTPFHGEILIKNLKTWEVVKAKKQNILLFNFPIGILFVGI
jgi:hypothetical protein